MSKHQQSKMLSIYEEIEQRCLAGHIPYSLLIELTHRCKNTGIHDVNYGINAVKSTGQQCYGIKINGLQHQQLISPGLYEFAHGVSS